MSGAPPVCLHTEHSVWDVVDSVSESGFSPSSLDFSLSNHILQVLLRINWYLEVGIGRIRGLTVPQVLVVYADGD